MTLEVGGIKEAMDMCVGMATTNCIGSVVRVNKEYRQRYRYIINEGMQKAMGYCCGGQIAVIFMAIKSTPSVAMVCVH